MKSALILCIACACAAPSPRPPPRVTESAVVEQVQVGWMQVATGQPYQPPVEDLRKFRTPDETHAREIAEDILAKCKAGKPLAPLQDEYSEAERGTVEIGGDSKLPFRDLALGLQPGECAMMRSNYAFHVVKRIR